MKNSLPPKQKNRLLALAVPFAALVLLVLNPADPRDNTSQKLLNTTITNNTPGETTDSQLIIYKKVRDSLAKIDQWNKRRLTGSGTGLFVEVAGVTRIDECDSCINANETGIRSKYFMSVRGFAMKEDASFRIDRNDYIIDRLVTNPSTTAGGASQLEHKKIGVRLADPEHGQKGLTLLIPISRPAYQAMKIVMYILMAIALFVGLWLFIILPVRILFNISNGKAFVKENTKNLNRIGWGLIIFCLVMIIVPKVIELALSSKMAGEIYYPVLSSVFDHRWTLFLGIALLILARAFKYGHQLQQWEDQTI